MSSAWKGYGCSRAVYNFWGGVASPNPTLPPVLCLRGIMFVNFVRFVACSLADWAFFCDNGTVSSSIIESREDAHERSDRLLRAECRLRA